MQKPRISLIAAIGKNRVLGKNNELLWHLPGDLKRFKDLTLGHPIIMGRKTFESILTSLGKPLPGRKNIVITRNPGSFVDMVTTHNEVIVVTSLESALYIAQTLDKEEIFIGGGAQVYEQVLPQADRLYLTTIDEEKEGDAYFPEYEQLFTKKISEETREENGLTYRWMTLEH